EDDLFDFSDNDGDDIPQHNVPQTQENEEIYRVNLSADTLPSHEYTHDSTRLPSRRARSNDEDKLQLLEAMTGVSQNNEDVPKQLGSGQKQFSKLGCTTDYTTIGYTSKCATLENTTKYATLGNTTKCSILGNITKRSTMGCTSKWSKLEHTSKCSTMEYATISSTMEHST
ncbi:unnamed protein product, partial [Brassica rapa subsp. narinosa]